MSECYYAGYGLYVQLLERVLGDQVRLKLLRSINGFKAGYTYKTSRSAIMGSYVKKIAVHNL